MKAEASLHLQELASRSRRTFGLWGLIANCPTLLFYPASQPCAIHVHCSSVRYTSGSLGPGAPITDAGSPLPLPVCSLFWLAPSLRLLVCLSIVEAGSCAPRGPAIAPPLSLFRVQTAAMVELLTVLMDPFVCHWNTERYELFFNILKTTLFLPLHLCMIVF